MAPGQADDDARTIRELEREVAQLRARLEDREADIEMLKAVLARAPREAATRS